MYIEHGSNYFQKSIVRPLLECRNPNTISMGHTLGYYNFPSRSFDNNCHHFTDFSIT